MSYSFSSNESENPENKATILEKLEQRLNEVTPKSVKMMNTTEGMYTEINNLKGEKNPVLLSKSSSVLRNNYSSDTIESLYNESNSNLKDRKKKPEFKNILSSLRTSERESGARIFIKLKLKLYCFYFSFWSSVIFNLILKNLS